MSLARPVQLGLAALVILLPIGVPFAATPRAPVAFTGIQIDDQSHGNASLRLADLDGDGELEILGAVIEDGAVVLWKRTASDGSEWSKQVIDGSFVAARSATAADIDGDGDLDVVAASYDGGEVAWWENRGGSPLAWSRHSVDASYALPHEVSTADVDGDGDQDILCASSGLHRITVWRNDAGSPIAWTEQTVADGVGMAKSVAAGDLDGDGRLDLVGAALADDDVLWWRNGGGDPLQWQEATIDGDFRGAHRVQIVDLDLDGRLDVLGAGYTGHTVAWWRNLGGSPLAWDRQVIAVGVPNACIAEAADIDGDGRLDVVASAQLTGQLLWWRNEGGEPIAWSRADVGTLLRVWPLAVGDIDGDGDVDVIAGSSHQGNNRVVWFRNELRRFATRRAGGRLVPGAP